MKPSQSLLTVSCIAAFLALGSTAHADTFPFAVTNASFTGSGTLTAVADPSLANVFDVTNISGSIDGIAITGLLPCATYSLANPCLSTGDGFLYDNLLYPSGVPTGIQVLDYAGIGFVLANGLDGDLAAFGTHQYNFVTNVAHAQDQVVGFSLTPEPDSFLLLGTGLLGLVGIARRSHTSRHP